MTLPAPEFPLSLPDALQHLRDALGANYGAETDDATLTRALGVDAVTARDERAGVTRAWTECEVELTREDLTEKQARAVFEAVEKVLFAAGAAPSSSVAKIARALGQDGGDTVRVVSPADASDNDAARSGTAGAAPDTSGTGTALLSRVRGTSSPSAASTPPARARLETAISEEKSSSSPSLGATGP